MKMFFLLFLATASTVLSCMDNKSNKRKTILKNCNTADNKKQKPQEISKKRKTECEYIATNIKNKWELFPYYDGDDKEGTLHYSDENNLYLFNDKTIINVNKTPEIVTNLRSILKNTYRGFSHNTHYTIERYENYIDIHTNNGQSIKYYPESCIVTIDGHYQKIGGNIYMQVIRGINLICDIFTN